MDSGNPLQEGESSDEYGGSDPNSAGENREFQRFSIAQGRAIRQGGPIGAIGKLRLSVTGNASAVEMAFEHSEEMKTTLDAERLP
jgi:hypothetical protein